MRTPIKKPGENNSNRPRLPREHSCSNALIGPHTLFSLYFFKPSSYFTVLTINFVMAAIQNNIAVFYMTHPSFCLFAGLLWHNFEQKLLCLFLSLLVDSLIKLTTSRGVCYGQEFTIYNQVDSPASFPLWINEDLHSVMLVPLNAVLNLYWICWILFILKLRKWLNFSSHILQSVLGLQIESEFLCFDS